MARITSRKYRGLVVIIFVVRTFSILFVFLAVVTIIFSRVIIIIVVTRLTVILSSRPDSRAVKAPEIRLIVLILHRQRVGTEVTDFQEHIGRGVQWIKYTHLYIFILARIRRI
jgi:hypothetical protein